VAIPLIVFSAGVSSVMQILAADYSASWMLFLSAEFSAMIGELCYE